MSKNQYEDNSLRQKRCCNYRSLKDTWIYSCSKTNLNYSSVGAGVNCLCPSVSEKRSTMDQYQLDGSPDGHFPVSNKRLGWKL
jgi:hypothetical protein